MNTILQKKRLADNIYSFRIKSPHIAKKAKPGHFVMLRISENGERIPLTIADYDKSSITFVVQIVGNTTKQLSKLKKGEKILDLVGPLGNQSEIEKVGTVCLIAGGCGCAEIYPIAKEFKKKKNKVVVIFGARKKNLLFWEKEFKKAGLDINFFTTRSFADDEILPWDVIDIGVSKKFLLKEYDKSRKYIRDQDKI